jgi:hypothetical protein
MAESFPKAGSITTAASVSVTIHQREHTWTLGVLQSLATSEQCPAYATAALTRSLALRTPAYEEEHSLEHPHACSKLRQVAQW